MKFKLFALWTSVVFFYIYGDYFELYQPEKLRGMLEGTTAFGPITQQILLGISTVVIVPCLMPFLSLALPAPLNRSMNIIFGTLYSVIMVLAMRGGWHFYAVYGTIEIALTALIVWLAWTWPKEPVLPS